MWINASAKTPLTAAPLAQSPSSRPSERGQRGGAAGTPWWLRHSCHLAQLASQQCTQMPQNGTERPDPPICVHYCDPKATHNPSPRRNSVHKRPKTVPRGHFGRSVYTPAIPPPALATGRGHGSHDIDGPMAPVMPGRLGPEAHAAKAVARPIVWSFRTPSASWRRTRPWRWRCRGGPPYLGWCQGSL